MGNLNNEVQNAAPPRSPTGERRQLAGRQRTKRPLLPDACNAQEEFSEGSLSRFSRLRQALYAAWRVEMRIYIRNAWHQVPGSNKIPTIDAASAYRCRCRRRNA